MRAPLRPAADDRGSAVIEFVLVAPLLALVGLAVLQLVLALHVRSTLTAAAGEGARVAALIGVDPMMGERRARDVLAGNLAADAVADVRVAQVVLRGSRMIEVTIDARLPLLGMLGPRVLSVTGHAVQESV